MPSEEELEAMKAVAQKAQEHHGLPVAGYRSQPQSAVDLVNRNKKLEEEMLRVLDELQKMDGPDGKGLCDQRWLAIGRTDLEKAFMAINRAIFKPERVKL